MSDGRDFLGRSRFAFFAALSCGRDTDTTVSPIALDTTMLVTEEHLFGFRSLCASMNLAQYLAVEAGLKREKDPQDG